MPRYLFSLPLLACLLYGCSPNPLPRPAGVAEKQVVAVDHGEILREAVADPIGLQKRLGNARVKIAVRCEQVGIRRGKVTVTQSEPNIIATGKLADMDVKPGDAITVVGRIHKISGVTLELSDCRRE